MSNSDPVTDPSLAKSALGHDVRAVGESDEAKTDSDPSESKIATAMLDSFESDAVICGTCHRISGWVRDKNWKQTCRCEKSSTQRELWRNRDFPTNAELCYCCGAVLLRSGSKFSVWFCLECKANVTSFNRRVGRYAIPIGRHSFMNSTWLWGKDAQDPAAAKAFHAAATEMGRGIDFIWNYAPSVVAENLGMLGYRDGASVLLREYLTRVATLSAARSSQAFTRLERQLLK